jgi:hypothetical protein
MDAQESEDAVDQIDPLGPMDDDPAPESAETHDAAVGEVEQAAVEPPPAEPHVTLAPEGIPVEHVRAEQADPLRDETAPAAPAASSTAAPSTAAPDTAAPATAEPAPASPATPDHADHDPQ